MKLPEMVVPAGATTKAVKACCDAMAILRSIGWPESSQVELERLWWTLHNSEGNLK